jgi:hypothetical protein
MKDPMKEIETDSKVYMFHNVIHDIYLQQTIQMQWKVLICVTLKIEKNGVYF